MSVAAIREMILEARARALALPKPWWWIEVEAGRWRQVILHALDESGIPWNREVADMVDAVYTERAFWLPMMDHGVDGYAQLVKDLRKLKR